MKVIGLICCRSESKGIKNKNLKKFHGKRILSWMFDEIKKSKLFDEIYFSSDSKKLCNIAKNLGMISDLRPKKLATSTSDVFDTYKYLFSKFNISDKKHHICCLNNSPYIKKKHLLSTFKLYKKSKFKNISMLVKKVDSENFYFRQSHKKNKLLYPIFQSTLIKTKINRQSQKDTFVNIGDIRWGKVKQLSKYKDFNIDICKNGYSFLEVKENEYLDLNTVEDWKMALKNFKK